MTSLFLIVGILIGSVLLSGMVVDRLQKSNNQQLIKILLAFSGGFLLAIAFIHFIPELYMESGVNAGVFILIGFLIQLLLEFFSGGIEHGHIHIHQKAKIPYGIILALCFHELMEGIPLGGQLNGLEIATTHHHEKDNSLLLGIIFHRLPVAIALMTLLVRSGISKRLSWIMLTLFALAAPIGVFLGFGFASSLSGFDLNIALAVVVGMFLHISTTIIFETSENHKFNLVKLLTILTGCALAFFIH